MSKQKKLQIADLYENNNLSVGAIADKLGVSVRTVHNYKNYNGQDKVNSLELQPELYDQDEDDRQEIEQEDDQYQDTELEDESEEFEQEIEKTEDYEPSEERSWEYIEVLKCPQCGKPKSECLTIDEALENELDIDEIYQHYYDYVCPNCSTIFPENRLQVPGTCPECGSTSIDWIPSEKSNVSEEIKRVSDFICLECWNPIKISDQ